MDIHTTFQESAQAAASLHLSAHLETPADIRYPFNGAVLPNIDCSQDSKRLSLLDSSHALGPVGRGRTKSEVSTRSSSSSPLLDLSRPAFDAITLCADSDVEFDRLHTFGILCKFVIAHAACIRSALGWQIEHWSKKVGDSVCLFHRKMILLPENVWERPVSQSVDVAELALAIENFLRPFSGQAQ